MHTRSRRQFRGKWTLAVIASIVATSVTVLASPAHAGDTTARSATISVPFPATGGYAGQGGGDGWAVAVGPTAVYNVFHHSSQLTVACHLESNAQPCGDPRTINDPARNGSFSTGAQPGLYLDPATQRLYVFGTAPDDTAGVVCIDTAILPTAGDPYCGFTALTAAGQSPQPNSMSSISDPVLIGHSWYAFNLVDGAMAGNGQDELLCFDTVTLAACSGQPYMTRTDDPTFSGTDYPTPAIAAMGTKIVVPQTVDGQVELACFDTVAEAPCGGFWPVQTPIDFSPSSYGAPYPMLDGSGAVTGICLPDGSDPCYSTNGFAAATPDGMTSAITGTAGWDGPALVLNTRVYVPDGNANQVDCYDYAATASCTGFPKSLANLGLLYSVNPDPQRPTCIWVNADNGSSQIQNFDAYTGGSCGQGPIRIPLTSFVGTAPACRPTAFNNLEISWPAPSNYSSGTVSFQDSQGTDISGIQPVAVSRAGVANLSGSNLTGQATLPQLVIDLSSTQGLPHQMIATLTWTGPSATACAPPTAYNYVALGDSFSSGEGNPPFLTGTDTKSDQCHRSSAAYAKRLTSEQHVNISSLSFVACSGAVIDNIEFANAANHENPQVSHLTKSTNLVTLSVGGNNVQFSTVLQDCITAYDVTGNADCQNEKVDAPGHASKVTLATYEQDLLNSLSEDGLCPTANGYITCHPSLQTLYEDIASRVAPHARIVVVLYPHLFTNSPAKGGCGVGYNATISKANIVWLNSEADKLDSAIIANVNAAAAAGVNVVAADPRTIWNDTAHGLSPGGHGVCSAQPWLNPLMGVNIDKGPLHIHKGHEVYSFHPNAIGQQAFDAAVEGVLNQ